MQFNEFQRLMRDAELSEKAQYLLTHMFEVQVEFSKCLDTTLQLMEKLTDRMQDVTHINTDLFNEVKRLRQGMMGVDVHSVMNEPEN